MGKYTDFGQRLTWYRSKAQMTQRDLADKSGVSLPQITRYETNRSTPRLSAVMKISEALGLDPEAFTDTSPIPDATTAIMEFPEGGETSFLIPDEILEQLQVMADASGKTLAQYIIEIVDGYIQEAHATGLEMGLKPADHKIETPAPTAKRPLRKQTRPLGMDQDEWVARRKAENAALKPK